MHRYSQAATCSIRALMTPPSPHATADADTTNLYVGNLPDGVTQEMLMEKFLPAGAIESVRIMRISGNGYVNYASIESAINARDFLRGTRASLVFPGTSVPPEKDHELQITFTTAQQFDSIQTNQVSTTNQDTEVRTWKEELGPQGLTQPAGCAGQDSSPAPFSMQ